MKETMDKENEIEDLVFTVEVDEGTIERVRSGETRYIAVDINDSNYRDILFNYEGHLALNVKKLPNKFHGCYYYNRGVFPYIINKQISFVQLHDDSGDHIVTKVIGIETEPHTRFRFKGPGKPSVEDPKGDSCIWQVSFELVPLPVDNNSYLMRWNPSISSFKLEDLDECLEHEECGVIRLNWSISEWQEARRGDIFYMMCTGDDKAGIVFTGQFITDPYPDEDWDGSNKRRMYVDMVCYGVMASDHAPRIPLEKLQSAVPSFEWAKGHSGVLLPDEVADKIEKLLVE